MRKTWLEISGSERSALAPAAQESLGEAISAAVAQVPGRRELHIRLGPGVYQRRLLAGLPKAGNDRLRRAITLQAGTYFRGGARGMVVAVVPGTAGNDAVLAVAVHAERFDEIAAAVTAAGHRLGGIYAEVDGQVVSLVTDEARRQRRHRRWRIAGICAAAGIVLATGLVWIAVWRMNTEIRSIDSSLERMKRPLGAVRLARAEARRLETVLHAFAEADLARGVVVARVVRTLRQTPDSAYFRDLEIDLAGRVTAHGAAAQPRALESLAARVGLRDVRVAELPDGTSRGWRRFSVEPAGGLQP